MREFVLAVATGNPNKVGEIQAVLGSLGVRVLTATEAGAPEDFAPVENGATFEENSRVKAMALAKALSQKAHVDDAYGAGDAGGDRAVVIDGVIADDSGLCVDALNGAPGVCSARFADAPTDERNTAKLLGLLDGVSRAERAARFVCVVTLVARAEDGSWTDGAREIVCRGECEGRIAFEPRGESGFGYDPVFIPLTEEAGKDVSGANREGAANEEGRAARTFAEMTPEEKNAISHRALALAQLYEKMAGMRKDDDE
ncbi:MAG: non-canonical purine NTP pyrophosphatase [Clostridiales Family XIII bacterium]|jgi:XTP/dITP diphosphohydrolase|nr:non-canonical purine NTP pyrophosphatase [Clostridiales Family XIII bacterium]